MFLLRLLKFLDILRLEKNSDGPTKRTPVTEQIFPGPLRLPRDPPGTPGDPSGTPRGVSETPRRPPGTPYGPQKQPYLDKYTAPEALDCCVPTCPLRTIALRTRPDRFVYKKAAKIKKGTPRSRDIAPAGGTNALAPYVPGYI